MVLFYEKAREGRPQLVWRWESGGEVAANEDFLEEVALKQRLKD